MTCLCFFFCFPQGSSVPRCWYGKRYKTYSNCSCDRRSCHWHRSCFLYAVQCRRAPPVIIRGDCNIWNGGCLIHHARGDCLLEVVYPAHLLTVSVQSVYSLILLGCIYSCSSEASSASGYIRIPQFFSSKNNSCLWYAECFSLKD